MGDVLKLIVGKGAPILAGCLGFFRQSLFPAAASIVGGVLTVGGAVGYLKPIPRTSSELSLQPLENNLLQALLLFNSPYHALTSISVAKFFGIPFADSTNTLFVPEIGGRNTAAGITALTLAFLEERRALGVLMAGWTLAGWSDIEILMATKGSENVFVHARNIVILVIISWRLLTTTI